MKATTFFSPQFPTMSFISNIDTTTETPRCMYSTQTVLAEHGTQMIRVQTEFFGGFLGCVIRLSFDMTNRRDLCPELDGLKVGESLTLPVMLSENRLAYMTKLEWVKHSWYQGFTNTSA